MSNLPFRSMAYFANNAWWCALVLVLIGAVGCGDAPHDNPLDPDSPDYDSRGSILVRTQTYYPPNLPVAGVSVLIDPGHFIQTTGQDGSILFKDLQPGPYTVVANKSGFAADTQQVTVAEKSQREVFLRLNAIPSFVSVSVHSEHVSAWFPVDVDVYRVEFAAQLADGDGLQDIDTVKVFSENFGELGSLRSTPVRGAFVATFEDDDLPLNSVFDLIGEKLWFAVNDKTGARSTSDPLFLARIVETTPAAESPSGLALTSRQPRFTWRAVAVPFEYTFRIDITNFQVEGQFSTLFGTINNIHADSTSMQLNSQLPRGAYYWTVSIVDRYGNRSRSRESSFRVE